MKGGGSRMREWEGKNEGTEEKLGGKDREGEIETGREREMGMKEKLGGKE